MCVIKVLINFTAKNPTPVEIHIIPGGYNKPAVALRHEFSSFFPLLVVLFNISISTKAQLSNTKKITKQFYFGILRKRF